MTRNKITESAIEQFTVDLLEKHGSHYIYGPDIALDAEKPVRHTHKEVISSPFAYNGFLVIFDGLERLHGIRECQAGRP